MNIKCSKCNLDKDESEFAFRNKVKQIRTSKCRLCHAEYVKNHYQSNKSTYITRANLSSKRYRKNAKRLIVEYLNDKSCIDCGITDIRVLDFDHRNPKSKTKEVSKMLSNCSWKTISEEINKCDIRCANCHRIRTAKQFNTYRNLK